MRLLLLCLTILAGAATAQDWRDFPEVYVDDTRLAGFEFGLFCHEYDGIERQAPNTITGQVSQVYNSRLMAMQQEIPAALGIKFGVRAMSASGPIDGVMFRISHPPMGPQRQTEQGWPIAYGDTSQSGQFWSFDEAYELQTGSWFMTATDARGELLFSVAFEVVPPDRYSGAIPTCIADLLG